eukprot:gnl/Spiro4/1305_TR697_c0_g1_i1.p1 gnl/Spiro4/1305_TR697_c0_g1~~gnl/Spiro4/1305_TR697_c0_g1_i1.p1  ORF type:complete len:305 (-),score=34.18 gnl/Spiro4/1305_TR697_c0_g1_i1:84-998(-)
MDKLQVLPWKHFCASGKVFYLKCTFDNGEYAMVASDLLSVWTRLCDRNSFRQEIKTFCPTVQSDSSEMTVLLTEYMDAMKPDTQYHAAVDPLDGSLSMGFETNFGILPFKWTFLLQPLSKAEASVYLRDWLIEPMVGVAAELARQVLQLQDLLKDSRGPTFNADAFDRDALTSPAFSRTQLDSTPLSCRPIAAVYRAVVEHKRHRGRVPAVAAPQRAPAARAAPPPSSAATSTSAHTGAPPPAAAARVGPAAAVPDRATPQQDGDQVYRETEEEIQRRLELEERINRQREKKENAKKRPRTGLI